MYELVISIFVISPIATIRVMYDQYRSIEKQTRNAY
jgi:hypothetical protein